jgi:hypothetical protein
MTPRFENPPVLTIDGKLYVDGGPSTRGWHFHEDMLRCPQLWSYKHKLNIVFPMSVPLSRGILIHTGLAQYYMRLKHAQNGGNVDDYHDPITSMRICAHVEDEKLGRFRDDGQPQRRGVKLKDDLVLVEEALVAYMARYAFDDIEIIAVEAELRAMIPPKEAALADMLRDPMCPVGQRVGNHALGSHYSGWNCTCPGQHLYTQRPDMAAKVDGWKFLVDHKSRGRRDKRQTRGYTMSGQFQGYGIFGQQLWGAEFGGRLLNYVTWGSESKAGKKTAPHFERLVPERKLWAERDFPDTIKHSERLMEMLKDEDPWHYPKTFIENGGCEHRYGPCVGQGLCSIGPAALATIGQSEDEDQVLW